MEIFDRFKFEVVQFCIQKNVQICSKNTQVEKKTRNLVLAIRTVKPMYVSEVKPE